MDNPATRSDAQLVEALGAVEPPGWAVRQLYEGAYRMCSSFVLQNEGNVEDAEDIFQDVIVDFIEMVQDGRFRGDSSITSMLYSMTRHHWLNELRRKGRARKREAAHTVSPDSAESDTVAQLMSAGEKRQIMSLIESLGHVCRDILVAFYYEGLPIREILSRTGYRNEQVLRNKKTKCMKALVETLTTDPALLRYYRSMLDHEK